MAQANAASLVAIDRSDWNLPDPKASQRELAQQVVRISVTLPQAIPGHAEKGALVHCHEAALGIQSVRPKRAPSEERKHVVAHPSVQRHRFACRRPAEPITLHIVGVTGNQGREQSRKILGVHLTIGSHHDGEARFKRDRTSAT
jgi:hypothetical protein